MPAAHAMNWVLLDHDADRPVQVGDVVSTDAGGMPIYRVVAMEGRQLVLDDERHVAQVMPLDRFRWRA